MSIRQILKRVEKVENRAENARGIDPVALRLAEAFTPDELQALMDRLLAKPGAVHLGDVLEANELADLSAKLAAA